MSLIYFLFNDADGEVELTLEEAMKAQKEGRGIALLFFQPQG